MTDHSPFRCGRFTLPLGQRTLIMGILNVTPDSFSGDAIFGDPERALARAQQMIADGADMIDIGGESTRPGSEPVHEAEEMRRIGPVLERLAGATVPVSVDTSKYEVAREALSSGASIINDVTALRADERMADLIARSGAGVVLMHMQGNPRNMQQEPRYIDVVNEVKEFLAERVTFARRRGIDKERIMIDPGIGFGKNVEHNLQLLRQLADFRSIGCPILVGTSRKSFIAKISGAPVNERVFGTAGSVALAIANGADVVRVHDVKEMKQVAAIADAVVRG